MLLNPVITPLRDDMEQGWEGCLSVPGLRGMVPRFKRLRYRGSDQYGRPIDRSVEGFHARRGTTRMRPPGTAFFIPCVLPISAPSASPTSCSRNSRQWMNNRFFHHEEDRNRPVVRNEPRLRQPQFPHFRLDVLNTQGEELSLPWANSLYSDPVFSRALET